MVKLTFGFNLWQLKANRVRTKVSFRHAPEANCKRSLINFTPLSFSHLTYIYPESKSQRKWSQVMCNFYSVFQGFSKPKSANGGLILSSSQFLILPQLPEKIKLASKVVKVYSKIIISHLRSKSLKLTVLPAVKK